jgi:hypothetical protein
MQINFTASLNNASQDDFSMTTKKLQKIIDDHKMIYSVGYLPIWISHAETTLRKSFGINCDKVDGNLLCDLVIVQDRLLRLLKETHNTKIIEGSIN